MRAKVLQLLAALVLALGFMLAPSSGSVSFGLDDCTTGSSTTCGGG